MSVTPSHYSNRYVNQRYNKALQIVQHLPASSAFQPSREEKLELYAYYKQVSHGNVNTQRPGIFDMVGRAKWDAWKRLEGLSKTDAKHLYVETLLKSATEAYKKNAGRATAQQIIQAFNIMQPSEDQSSGDDSASSAAEEDDINSLTSADAEEQAYLREIQANAGRMTPASSYSRRRLLSPRASRPPSASRRRPGSVASQASASTATKTNNDRLLPHMIPQHERRRAMLAQRTQDDEPLDANPWAPTQPLISTSTTTLTSSPPAPPTPRQHRSTHLTPRQHPRRPSQAGPAPPRSPASMPRPSPDVMSVVALGPATKRALESLQAEVVALNERIDDLRHELARETSRPPSTITPVPPIRRPTGSTTSGSSDATDDEKWEGWRWVIKAAIKHAAINLISVLIFFYFLYKRKSPVAFAITDQLSKISSKLRVLLQGSTSATTTIV